jgi:imidazolonepropionase
MKKADIVILNASEVLTCASNDAFSVDVVRNGYVAIEGKQIVSVGKMDDLPAHVDAAGAEKIDASGKTVAPGFVDCHTHLVFGGSRVEEYAARLTDNDAESLRSKGVPVGIRVTVDATRDLPFETLLAQSEERLREMLLSGTTTVESKSGYGFSTDSEIKMLRINRELEKRYPVDIASTFLGAHGWPGDVPKADYVRLLKEEMFPAVAEAKLAEFCDIWCDEGYYTAEECRDILGRGEALGMKPRIHAEGYSWIGGSDVAADMRMSSSDHLNYTPRETLRKLAKAGVVGVLLPMIDFAVKHPRPFDPKPMLEEGLSLALATNCCPGCWCNSMPFVLALACRNHGLTAEVAIKAATRGGAKALTRLDHVGTLEPGKAADIQIWNLPSYKDIVYRLGSNAVETVLKNGRISVSNGRIIRGEL